MEAKRVAAPLAFEENSCEMDDEDVDLVGHNLLNDPLGIHLHEGGELSKASGQSDEKQTTKMSISHKQIPKTNQTSNMEPSIHTNCDQKSENGAHSKGDNSESKGGYSRVQQDDYSDSYESRLDHCLDADEMCVDLTQNDDIESRQYSKTPESPQNEDDIENNTNTFQAGGHDDDGDDDDDSNTELFATEDLYTPGRHRRQFLIGVFLKYSIFIFNFLFWVAAVCGFGYGYWMLTSRGQIFSSGIYSVLEPPVLLCTVSFIIFIVAFFGFLGALRENILLLKIFRISLVLVLLIQTVIGIMVFVFYTMPEARETLLAGPESVLKDAIKRYHDDKGSREWIDLIQKEFKCCGISHTKEGYKDWQINMYFNCSQGNPSIERCAVPVSCCIFEPGDYVNVMCGFGTTNLPYIKTRQEIKMMNSFLSVFLFAVFFDQGYSGCTFPNRLIGKWITGHDKGYDVITVNSTHMLGFSVGVITNLDFSCFIHDGQDTYAMRSSQDQNLLGLKVDIYICWHILSVSYDEFSVKELAHRVSQNSDEKGIAFLPGGSPTFSQICEPEDKTDKPRILYRRH